MTISSVVSVFSGLKEVTVSSVTIGLKYARGSSEENLNEPSRGSLRVLGEVTRGDRRPMEEEGSRDDEVTLARVTSGVLHRGV